MNDRHYKMNSFLGRHQSAIISADHSHCNKVISLRKSTKNIRLDGFLTSQKGSDFTFQLSELSASENEGIRFLEDRFPYSLCLHRIFINYHYYMERSYDNHNRKYDHHHNHHKNKQPNKTTNTATCSLNNKIQPRNNEFTAATAAATASTATTDKPKTKQQRQQQ